MSSTSIGSGLGERSNDGVLLDPANVLATHLSQVFWKRTRHPGNLPDFFRAWRGGYRQIVVVLDCVCSSFCSLGDGTSNRWVRRRWADDLD